ncbi:MAG: NAD-dependent epimerase/dehydratase family protein [Deltaproteobacteria bacterium]|nr:NAD-dependent epimerase/dehydratase family protein [Deltaproteobacteria bacterium]
MAKKAQGSTKKTTAKSSSRTAASSRRVASGVPAETPIDRRLALVNGAGGFLGLNVVRELVRQGWHVRASDLPQVRIDHLSRDFGVETQPADLLDLEQCRALVNGVTHVFNLAGLFNFAASREQLFNANVKATEMMCRAASGTKLERFVHVATIGVYGRMGRRAADESWPHRPKNPYEATKEQGEAVAFHYARTRGLPVVSLRPTVIYGPRSRYGVVTFLSAIAMLRFFGIRKAPAIPGGPKLSHVHVEDVARALVHIATHGKVGEAYNCADDTPQAWGDLATFMAGEFGIEPADEYHVPDPVFHLLGRVAPYVPKSWLAGRQKQIDQQWQKLVEAGVKDFLKPTLDMDFLGYLRSNHILDTGKLKNTGFRLNYPRTVDGLRQTIEWYREAGWLPRLDQFHQSGSRATA